MVSPSNVALIFWMLVSRKNSIPEASSTQSQLQFIGNWFVTIICVLCIFVDAINLLKLYERCD